MVNLKEKRRQPALNGNSWRQSVWEYTLLVAGSLIVAISFNIFLNPNQLVTGGVSGLSIIARHLLGLEPAVTQWALNIPLFIAGIWLLGKQFGIKVLIGSTLMPLFVFMTRNLPTPTDNILLASLYGGILCGFGLGLVFRGRGSTGGLDLAAQIIHKYTGIPLGGCIAMLDGLVILTAGVVFSPEKALYALIGLFVTSKTINIVQVGFSYSMVAFIISDKTEEVKQAVFQQLDRGVTELQAFGGYTGADRRVLMVVASQTELSQLKELVKRTDMNAFVILSDTHEVLGKGFKR